jgi:hypothetical protein
MLQPLEDIWCREILKNTRSESILFVSRGDCRDSFDGGPVVCLRYGAVLLQIHTAVMWTNINTSFISSQSEASL